MGGVRSLSAAWNRAAVMIQKNYRMHSQRTRYLAIIRGVVRIQACYRGYAVRAVQYYGFMKKQNESGRGVVTSMKKCFFLFNFGRLYYSTVYGLNTLRELLSFNCTLKNMKSVIVLAARDWEGKGMLHKYKHGLELTVSVDGGERIRSFFLSAPTAKEKQCLKRVIETSLARAEAKRLAGWEEGDDSSDLLHGHADIASRESVQNFRDAKFADVASECADYFKKVKEAKHKTKLVAAQAAQAANGFTLKEDEVEALEDVDIDSGSFLRQSRRSMSTRDSFSKAYQDTVPGGTAIAQALARESQAP